MSLRAPCTYSASIVLFSFFLVVASLLWLRYCSQGGARAGDNPWLPAAHIIWLLLSAIGELAVTAPFVSSISRVHSLIGLRTGTQDWDWGQG